MHVAVYVVMPCKLPLYSSDKTATFPPPLPRPAPDRETKADNLPNPWHASISGLNLPVRGPWHMNKTHGSPPCHGIR